MKKSLVRRNIQKRDRRQLELILTDKGQFTFNRLRGAVQLKLTEKISKLTDERKEHLANGLIVLRETFL